MDTSPEAVTDLLNAWRAGDAAAREQLFVAVYAELRRIAQQRLRREFAGRSLLPSDLVNEAFLRLVVPPQISWQNRAHFYAIASTVMRRILVDHARQRDAKINGGALTLVALDAALDEAQRQDVNVLALDDALRTLEKLDLRQHQVVEHRFFSGLTIEETAEALGISPSVVSEDWKIAKLWLHRELSR